MSLVDFIWPTHATRAVIVSSPTPKSTSSLRSTRPNSARTTWRGSASILIIAPSPMAPTNSENSDPLIIYIIQMISNEEEKKPKVSFELRKRVDSLLHTKNYFICKCHDQILAFCIPTRLKTYIHVITDDFLLFNFPPYLFACVIGQFLYLYLEENLDDSHDLMKVKISKLEVKAICKYNKGYFMGGYNRSPLPGGKHTNKRTIYYLEELSAEKKAKPINQITIPKNQQPISVITVQSPYLVCACSPFIYVLNLFTEQILLTLQKPAGWFLMLEGRFAFNTLNIIGVSAPKTNIFTMDVEKTPVFGVQVSEHELECRGLCQSKEGRIYIGHGYTVSEYNPTTRELTTFKTYEHQVIQLICTLKNSLLVVLRAKKQGKAQTIIQVFNLQ